MLDNQGEARPNAAGPAVRPRSAVIACVDASNYLPSVCQHAAWAAERLGAELRLLHAGGASDAAEDLLGRAADILVDEGVERPAAVALAGGFLDAAAGAAGPHDLLVLGRRGRATDESEVPLGANVIPVVRRAVSRVLVAPRLFLAIRRVALCFGGDDAADRRVRAFAAAALQDLEVTDSSERVARDDADMICCPREVMHDPAKADALFAVRRPVLVI